jgi:hypothetical protein
VVAPMTPGLRQRGSVMHRMGALPCAVLLQSACGLYQAAARHAPHTSDTGEGPPVKPPSFLAAAFTVWAGM